MNHKFGTTVVIITHNEAIAGMADQVIRLKDGQIFENCMNEKKISAAELAL
jgi:putative ABC transport system ATP-binding protein